ncbi:hypothetical protein CBQ26_10015 [Deinococcus indicus]|uniref:DUF11 domain-containing protein n=1 Tax=Deinococcus indicus TaxID=223556 RepID=A0A246BLB7_9DEIO|nr:DUF11 domain-containing protein [Deinococcus indicus]OWL96119.1 hypothetical protein CBQ26_10015 [Deinococcus indicus]
MRPARLALLTAALCGVLLPSLAAAQSAACALPGRDGPTYVRNTYYPGSGTASAAGRTLNLGTLRSGADAATAPLTPGDLVFVIQMQDGVLNNSNSVAYGNGSTGRGVTDLRGAGRYEFGVVTAVSGAVVTLRDPLRYTYESGPATASAARRSFQVLRVPQHSALTLSGTVRPPVWNGETGGVVVFDVAGTLNMGGATVDASAAGFRGGGSFVGGVISGANAQDYAGAYTTITSRGAMKGEGHAGTPTLVRGATVTGGYTGTPSGLAAGDLGYPGGLTVARGAPGNAGGGGTQHNAGGGGGGNVGTGGTGGWSYGVYRTQAQYDALAANVKAACRTLTSGATTYYACQGDGSREVGGLGGQGLAPDATRLFAGGGGGAGDSNNAADAPSTAQSSGGTGGGVIFIRAGRVTGNGVLRSNGQNGEPAGRDAAGGGGAGGTVAVVTTAGVLAGVTAEVRGGAGGKSGLPLRGSETQGSGAGGGGGAVLLAQGVRVGSADVAGGNPGLNEPVAGITNPYGAQAGAGGTGEIVYDNAAAPLPGLCTPALTVTKTTATPTRFTTSTAATYTITVSNAAGRSEATDVTVQDPALPARFTFARTQAITLGGGATRTAVTDPAPGSAAPAWGTFTLPAGAAVSVTFDVTLAAPDPATYQNAAQASYLDPARTSAAGTATATFDPQGSAAEDVTVFTPPRVPLQKWVRNVTRGTPFGTQGGGQPGDTLEYCIAFRNEGGFVAANFALRDTIPANSLALPGAYGTSPAPAGAPLGVRLSAQQVQAGEFTPAGTDLTAAADADAASLSAGGLTYTTDLAAGAGGSVCFRTQVR